MAGFDTIVVGCEQCAWRTDKHHLEGGDNLQNVCSSEDEGRAEQRESDICGGETGIREEKVDVEIRPRFEEEKNLGIEVVVVDVEDQGIAGVGFDHEIVKRSISRPRDRSMERFGRDVGAIKGLDVGIEREIEVCVANDLRRNETVVGLDFGIRGGRWKVAANVQGIGTAFRWSVADEFAILGLGVGTANANNVVARSRQRKFQKGRGTVSRMTGFGKAAVFIEEVARSVEEKDPRIEVVVVDVEGQRFAFSGSEGVVVKVTVSRGRDRGVEGLRGDIRTAAVLDGRIGIHGKNKVCKGLGGAWRVVGSRFLHHFVVNDLEGGIRVLDIERTARDLGNFKFDRLVAASLEVRIVQDGNG